MPRYTALFAFAPPSSLIRSFTPIHISFTLLILQGRKSIGLASAANCRPLAHSKEEGRRCDAMGGRSGGGGVVTRIGRGLWTSRVASDDGLQVGSPRVALFGDTAQAQDRSYRSAAYCRARSSCFLCDILLSDIVHLSSTLSLPEERPSPTHPTISFMMRCSITYARVVM